MALYGVSFVLTYTAWDSSAGAPKTGDVANHTLRWIKDGTASAPTSSPSEVDATNAPGEYKVTMTAAEAEAIFGKLAGKSSTANVSIIPIAVAFEKLPNALPGENGGLPTVDANNRIAGMQGAINTLDGLDTAQGSQHSTTQGAIAALNDLAATDILSDGTALNTTSGVLDRVTLVDTTSTNTDMRGTDSAYTGTPPTAAQVAGAVWEEALADHSGTSGSTAESLNNASAPTAAQVADAVWDEAAADHVASGSMGEALGAAGGASLAYAANGSATYNSATKELRVVAWLEQAGVVQNATAATLSVANDVGTEIIADGSFTKAENDDYTWLWTISDGSGINAVKNYIFTAVFTVGGTDYTRKFAYGGQGA